MLLSLNFKQPHDTIHKASPYTCYKNAVLGVPPMKSWASRSEVAEHKIKMTLAPKLFENRLNYYLFFRILRTFEKRTSESVIFFQ